jgi:hypothetical protein
MPVRKGSFRPLVTGDKPASVSPHLNWVTNEGAQPLFKVSGLDRPIVMGLTKQQRERRCKERLNVLPKGSLGWKSGVVVELPQRLRWRRKTRSRQAAAILQLAAACVKGCATL